MMTNQATILTFKDKRSNLCQLFIGPKIHWGHLALKKFKRNDSSMVKLQQHWSSYLPPFGIMKKEGANSETEGVCNHHHLGNGGKPTSDTLKCFGTVMRLAILVTHK